MKKLFYLILSFCFSQEVDAQLNFFNSSGNLPQGFSTSDLYAKSPTEIYAVGSLYQNQSYNDAIYTSLDGGTTWSSMSYSGIFSNQTGILAICEVGDKLLVSTQDQNGGASGIYFSTNNGTTWTDSNWGVPDNFLTYDFLAISETEIYAVGAIYDNNVTPKIYKSTNGGTVWTSQTTVGLDTTLAVYNTITYQGGKFLIGVNDIYAQSNAIYSSVDGINWSLSSNGIPLNFVTNEILIISNLEGYAIGSFDQVRRMYRSVDGGSNWSYVYTYGVPASQHSFTSAILVGNKMFTSTASSYIPYSGIYVDTIENLSIQEITNSPLVSYFPNPASEKITFKVDENIQLYSLKLVDLFGNKIAYSNSVSEIDISKLQSGMYFIEFQTDKGLIRKAFVKE